jgi:hypothetical protein
MKKEKREENKERIVVLDQGLDMDDVVGPRGLCCKAALFPFRG